MKKLIVLIYLWVGLPVVTVAAPLQLLSPPTAKLDEPTIAIIEQFLDTKWDKQSSNETESESIFAQAPTDNPQVFVAYALNRMRHGRTNQALQVASKSRLRFKENWDSRIIEVWLLTLTDDYDAAIVQMRSFKKQLEVAKTNNRLPASVEQKLYLRFGRLIGYLEGPVVKKVNAQILADTTILLKQNLAPDTKKAFDLARQSVKTSYEQLLADQVDYQNQELTKVAASNQIEKERLEEDNQLVQEARARLVPQIEQLTNEGHLQTSDLERQISAASTSLNSLNQSAFRLERELSFLHSDLFSVDRRFRSNVFAIENQIFRVDLELSRQRIAAANQAGQLNSLQNELFSVRQNLQRQIGQANRNLRRTEVAQKRNVKQLQKIAAGPKIAGGKSQALAYRRTALKTYDDLSLELYRQEMLEAVR